VVVPRRMRPRPPMHPRLPSRGQAGGSKAGRRQAAPVTTKKDDSKQSDTKQRTPR